MSPMSLDASSLPPDAQVKLQEYKKIVKFRDEVLSGAHPRVKAASAKLGTDDSYSVPSSNALNLASSASSGAAAVKVNGNAQVVDNSRSYQANVQRTPVNGSATFPGLGMLSSNSVNSAHKAFATGKPEINPVLLEKSDDLIKAEIQLQRQRLERSLRDQIDQKRAATKALQQAPEPLCELDLADVLTRALNLVQATAPQPTDDAAANPSNESDSFDDNTFYSSRHDTPETPQVSRVLNGSEDGQMREDSYEPQLDPPPVVPAQNLLGMAPPSPARDPPSRANPTNSLIADQGGRLGAAAYISGFTNNRMEGLQVGAAIELTSSDGSGPASRSEESGNTAAENTADQGNLNRINDNLLGQALNRRNSPVVRAHNLSPIAPQPEHVSPLAISRQPRIAQEDASARQATPAQVAALRQLASAGTTPESSPQGNKNDRKKKKKKKKAERLAAEAAAHSPYIKSEPRSPSPVNAPPYSRPRKRQRPNHSQQPSLNYEEPASAGGSRRQRYGLRSQNREERAPVNGNYSDFRTGPGQLIDVDDPRNAEGYTADPRSSYGGLIGQQSAVAYSVPYGQEPRMVREEAVSYPYDQRDALRTSAHPGASRDRSRSPRYQRSTAAMAPPMPPTRIVIDELGREYMEPSRPATVIREAVVPGGRVGDSEFRYERVPPRTASQRLDTFEQDGVIYRRVSPTYVAPPRRVITQPESIAPEYRAYREREYSVRPMALPSDEYGAPRARVVTEAPRDYITRATSVRPPEGIRYETTVGYERRPLEEPLREYLPARAASVRPVESVRYEVPVGYERRVMDEPTREYGSLRAPSVRPAGYELLRDLGTRFGSVRPEVPHREYTASVHPDARREAMASQSEARPYSVRPFDGPPTPHQVIRQEYSVRPVEQYYSRPPPRQDEEVVFLEHPPQSPYH